jgi:hypothetical protein
MAMQLLLERVRSGSYDSKQPGDSSAARDRMALLHMLVAHGARWMPEDKKAIGDVRKRLLKLVPAFSMEFAWLMKRYGAARRTDVRDLLTSPTMRRHLSGVRTSLERILNGIPEEVTPCGSSAGQTRPSQDAQARTEAEPSAADEAP